MRLHPEFSIFKWLILVCLILILPAIPAATNALNNTERMEVLNNSFPTSQIMAALKLAYPERISEIRLQNNDWSLCIDSHWFNWDQGRMLPADGAINTLVYAAYPFYHYQTAIPDYLALSKEDALRIELSLEENLAKSINRNPAFYDALWQANSKNSAWENMERVLLFGKKVSVHHSIVKALAAAQEDLYQQRQHDTELNRFLNRIDSVETWNWRTIQGTESRSFHSYGVAFDLVINSEPDARLYWLWARAPAPGWYLNALRNRLIPPPAMVKILENYGFVWGGKWRMFDSMHFEYRPEIMILNKIPVNLKLP